MTKTELRLVAAARILDAAWAAADDATDDDNIVPTDLHEAWMAAHRELRAALDALDDKL